MKEGLEGAIGQALLRRGWTLATAESCTAGLISHRITNVAGSSEYFVGGIVAYADAVKAGILGVRQSTLDTHGAVSRETALEMARGARRVLEADVSVSVTGIAGPGGGTPEKPVGLTWVAVSSLTGERVGRHVWEGDRASNKVRSAEAAMTLLLELLQEGE